MSSWGPPADRVSSTVTIERRPGPDPVRCDEFAFGLGTRDGVLVLRYQSGGDLQLGATREDFLHQLYWSPDGPLCAQVGARTTWLGAGQGFWARRAASHYLRASTRQTVYRICLRRAPADLEGNHAGVVRVGEDAREAIVDLCDPARTVDGSRLRTSLLDDVHVTDRCAPPDVRGPGYASAVAGAITTDPGDAAGLQTWAQRLHISTKTLQRDFQRTYGTSFSTWRSAQRLTLAQLLLPRYSVSAVAEMVGYASTSAFVAAFRRAVGTSPGAFARDHGTLS